jgi:hypothetical protein
VPGQGEFIYTGPYRLWQTRKAVIVNSRQSKFPIGTDSWVVATHHAIAWLKDRRYTLIASTGMSTWELTLAMASDAGLDCIVVVPESTGDKAAQLQHLSEQYSLGFSTTGICFIAADTQQSGKKWWAERDRIALLAADLIIPVSVRPGGLMDGLCASHGKKVESGFQIEYEESNRPFRTYERFRINPTLDRWEFLTHLTRTKAGPWPGQTALDYYREVIASREDFCHTGEAALDNILRTGTIVASAHHVRGGYRVVALTSLLPQEMKSLFTYRRRFLGLNFEPYGVAIRLKRAEKKGIRPVIYGPPALFESLSEADKPYYQNPGSNRRLWTHESEWRHLGDLCLSDFAVSDLAVVVPFMEDARRFESRCPYDIIPLFLDE